MESNAGSTNTSAGETIDDSEIEYHIFSQPSTSAAAANFDFNKDGFTEIGQINNSQRKHENSSTNSQSYQPIVTVIPSGNIMYKVSNNSMTHRNNQIKPKSIIDTIEISDDDLDEESEDIEEVEMLTKELETLTKIDIQKKKQLQSLRENVRQKNNSIKKSKALLKSLKAGSSNNRNNCSNNLQKAKTIFNKKSKNSRTIKTLLNLLKRKNFIIDEFYDLLSQIAQLYSILQLTCTAALKEEEIGVRVFVLTLNFYSPKTYNFIHNIFSRCCLPKPQFIHNLYKNDDFKPGFTSQSVNYLKTVVTKASNKNQKIFVNITFDEQSIKLQRKPADTYIPIGEDDVDNDDEIANIFVIMIVSINQNWKIPLGYFPIHQLTGEQKRNIIQLTVKIVQDTGVQIIGITFNGSRSNNISTMKFLGCDLLDLNKNYTVFTMEHLDLEIVVSPDPLQMLTMVRNTFRDIQILIDKNGNKINWQYLIGLENLQNESHWHLNNKFTEAQIYFQKHKIKITQAVEILSPSLIDALDFCRETLKLPTYADSEATSEFLKMFNDITDLLTSQSIRDNGFKQAICIDNLDILKHFVDTTIDKLLNLYTINGERIIHHEMRIGFLGLIVCLKNTIFLANKYIRCDELTNLPLSRLTLNPIESFFDIIRTSIKKNSSDSSYRQFIEIYKKLLEHPDSHHKGNDSVAMPVNNFTIYQYHQLDSIKQINNSVGRKVMFDIYDGVDNDKLYFDKLHEHIEVQNYLNYTGLSEYTENVLDYIIGFVVLQMKNTLKCIECSCALDEELITNTSINSNTMAKPSKYVIMICKQVETEIRRHIKIVSPYTKNLRQHMVNRIQIAVQEYFLRINLFPDFHEHLLVSQHYVLLFNTIVDNYIEIRFSTLIKKSVHQFFISD